MKKSRFPFVCRAFHLRFHWHASARENSVISIERNSKQQFLFILSLFDRIIIKLPLDQCVIDLPDELRWLRLDIDIDIGQISVANESRDFMLFYRENVVRANSKNIDVSLKWENIVRDVIFYFVAFVLTFLSGRVTNVIERHHRPDYRTLFVDRDPFHEYQILT